MNIKGHKRYTDEDIIEEANLYLKHKSMRTVSFLLDMPLATVGWHLKHRLDKADYKMYTLVNDIAKNNLKRRGSAQ